ncbi:hypothetical protein FHW36_1011015 [Chitinophaga polysaccharea]|uniref:Uncharacterized protein n=1 Tax=Chitinophaga polysaccharea TaxID=1293035 RepID=A0A561Q432_9BACT|nr:MULTISPECIES: hypothetical protein [Chitinophaga]NLR61587.1 hypothetical protein [Chitinophaga polysaccharea]NLU93818.1 hypothetical protein [Chitinophaga sp. Ak27]TWF45089.1 hypothetical protein FHW36_1011015 [Chitinophaga polysaccharea]
MKKLLLMLLVILAAATSANASTGFKNGDNNGDKNGDNNDNRNNSKNTNNTKPVRVEEFVLMFPRVETAEKVDEAELEKAIVDLYKWYLQNETKLNTNDFLKGSGKELAFPFKVDPKTLQQYFLFIKKNFPGFGEDDLSNVKRNRKKEAPVTVRDEMDNPMSISVNR